jgi:iron(III) transport system substrate-binding protein
VAAAALVVALATACGGSAPERTRVLVYSAHGKDLLAEVEADFERARPGVDVVWQDMGADQCYDRLRGERANPQADVWWGGPAFRFAQAAAQDLLDAHEPSWAAAAPAGTHDRTWRWAGHFTMPQVIAFQRDLVKDPPKDWDDLTRPEWKGRVVLRDPSQSGGMKAAFGAMFARGFANDGTDAAGLAWVRGLAANRHSIAPNPAKLFDTFRRDTAGVVTIWNLTDVLYQSEVAEPRVPFGWVAPASGAPMFPDGIALVARGGRGPNPAAADFYEFVTGADVSLRLAEKHRRFLVRTDVAKPSWAERIDVKPMDVDWDLVATHLDRWQKLWEDALAER